MLRILSLFFFCLALLPAQTPATDGAWEGALETPAGKLRLRLNLATVGGKLTANLDSLDQGARGIPCDVITLEGKALKWEIKRLMASYEGILNAAGNQVEGKLTQGGATFPLNLAKRDKPIEPPKRPQEPKPPFPYKAEEVAFQNKVAGIKLAGTLTLPPGKGPFPAIALITGSGRQNRDEELFGHKPFAVIADYLTRRGVAVLRYDDRGAGASEGKYELATTADLSTDAEAAFDYLKTRPEVDAKKIGLGGHSEGGVIAPMVATRNAQIAFLVLLAGTAVPGDEVLLEQGAAILRAQGASQQVLDAQREMQTNLFAALREAPDAATAEKKLRELLGGSPAIETQVKSLLSPWMRYFLTYDPAVTLTKVKCPVLALNGEKDLQVVATQNLPPLAAALKKAGNKDVTIVRLPGLNHLFQTAQKGTVAEYGEIEETMSPKALETMAEWITKRFGATGSAAGTK
jgi:fermentation-respiration switch protein FrsA (DUF1100 family)